MRWSHSYFWFAPLWVRSAKCRRQSPEWAILSHVDSFVQGEEGEVKWFQVLLDSLHLCGARASWWSPPVLQCEAVKIFSESVSSGSCAVWPNRERCHAWTVAERCRCSVVCRPTSLFRTRWYHLIPNSLCRHHRCVDLLGGNLLYELLRSCIN